MSSVRVLLALVLALAARTAAAQNPWREYPSIERGWSSTTTWDQAHENPGEFVIGRLMFPQSRTRYVLGGGGGNWLRGGTAWTVDYPEADRTLARILSRLTKIDVRAVEQPVNLDDDIDAYYWPFLISGLVGAWDLSDAEAAKLREYLLRGGFLLCDSFYGDEEWSGFIEGMSRVFPDRAIVELPSDHPIFHAVYDLSDRPRVPTWQHLPWGGYRNGSSGATPHWRGILDDDGRVMVMITYNNDIADGWQWADDARYPHDAAHLALALGVNFAVYAMTH